MINILGSITKSLIDQGVLGIVIILLCIASASLWRSRNKAIDLVNEINEKRINETKENFEKLYDVMTATNNLVENIKEKSYDKKDNEKNIGNA